jgi:hypothetical protein
MTDEEYIDCPTVWFAVLERAIRDGDYERAAAAQCELKRLGVKVKFPASAVKPKKSRAQRNGVAEGGRE